MKKLILALALILLASPSYAVVKERGNPNAMPVTPTGSSTTDSLADLLATGNCLTRDASGALNLTQAINAKTNTTPYTILSTDACKIVTHTGSTAISELLPQVGTTGFGTGFAYTSCNYTTASKTVTPTTSTINSATSLSIPINSCAKITSDGQNYLASVGSSSTASNAIAIPPKLAINFLPNVLHSDMTYTRNSTGWCFNSAGTLASTATNTPCFQHTAGGTYEGIANEPARTNIFLNSQTPATQNITVTAQAYTLSFYGTGSITLSGTATGVLTGTNATTLASLTFTPTAGTLTATVAGTITNAQLEAGSYATSRIVTGAGSVTRAVTELSNTATGFTKWYNQASGWCVVEGKIGNTINSNASNILVIDDGSENNQWTMFQKLSGKTAFCIYSGGSLVICSNDSVSTIATGGSFKAGFTWGAGSNKQAVNGELLSLGATGIAATPPTATHIRVMNGQSVSRISNGGATSLRCGDTTLTATQLMEATR